MKQEDNFINSCTTENTKAENETEKKKQCTIFHTNGNSTRVLRTALEVQHLAKD